LHESCIDTNFVASACTAFQVQAAVDLAPGDAGGELLAKFRVLAAEFIRQAKLQIQVPVVDSANLAGERAGFDSLPPRKACLLCNARSQFSVQSSLSSRVSSGCWLRWPNHRFTRSAHNSTAVAPAILSNFDNVYEALDHCAVI
jgi:hypothetical protein